MDLLRNLRVTKRAIERTMLGVFLRDRIRIEEIRRGTKSDRHSPKNYLSGSGQGTLPAGWTTAGVVKFWSGGLVPEGVSWVGLLQGGPMTWWKSRETAGFVNHGTGRCCDTWGSPMSSTERQSADMMKKSQKLNFIRHVPCRSQKPRFIETVQNNRSIRS